MATLFSDAALATNTPACPGTASYSALRRMQIEEVRRKGGFTYLGTDVNGVDVFEYERLNFPDELPASPADTCEENSPADTCELKAWNFVVPVCTCENFQRTHLPCAHCEALQQDLWESLRIARAQAKLREIARLGCWAEMPIGSGEFVWLEEFALTESDLRDAEIRNIVLHGNHQKSTLPNKSKAQRRGNATGLTIERAFRHAPPQYTS